MWYRQFHFYYLITHKLSQKQECWQLANSPVVPGNLVLSPVTDFICWIIEALLKLASHTPLEDVLPFFLFSSRRIDESNWGIDVCNFEQNHSICLHEYCKGVWETPQLFSAAIVPNKSFYNSSIALQNSYVFISTPLGINCGRKPCNTLFSRISLVSTANSLPR